MQNNGHLMGLLVRTATPQDLRSQSSFCNGCLWMTSMKTRQIDPLANSPITKQDNAHFYS